MNNEVLEKYSSEEIKTDIMRYKTNGVSFWLCMLAIIFNVAMFLVIYTKKSCTPNLELGIDLLVNVIFMLAVFLVAEKSKAYSIKAGYVAMGLGLVEIVRIFWIPLKYLRLWNDWTVETQRITETLTQQGMTPEQIATQLPSLVGLSSSQFILCVVFLVAACLCLIAAGVIAISKAKKLNAHLEKINERG